MEDAGDGVVIEEREELMVSPGCGDQFLRKGYFLTPSGSSSAAALATPPAVEHSYSLLKVDYHGWRKPREQWISWIDELYSSHHSTWKRAGILDAIMASKCDIRRCNYQILQLVEKWCPKTNSFVFPWGEASITLEDIMVLGGYPLLGESVLIPPQNEETVKKLESARSQILKSRSKRAYTGKWMAQFKGSGSDIEHAAFLCYWLSRFVFPSSQNEIRRKVMPIALHLARGTQIALAPTLLATIYKSLTILKVAIIRSQITTKGEEEFLQVSVAASFAFVQVWIWERFPSVQPVPVSSVGPGLARWDGLKLGSEYNKPMLTDSKDFQWRPYTSASPYQENERREMVDSNLCEELKGFVRCLRTSELVSLEDDDDDDGMEHYLPHRVARQFGMDQDIPGDVELAANVTWETAWKHYNRPIRDTKLYVPPRLSEPHITCRYLSWWKSGTTTSDLFGRNSEADDVFSLAWKKKQKKIPLCGVSNSGKGLKIKLSIRSNPPPKSPKRRGKLVEKSSGKRRDNDDGDPASKSSKKRKKCVAVLSDDNPPGGKGKSSTSSLDNMQCHEDANNGNVEVEANAPTDIVDEEGDKSPGTGFEERIGNVEKLVAFIAAGKLVLRL